MARSADTTHGAKILLVDDRPENLLALEAILSSLEQELVCVRSGEAAVDSVAAGEFAVILLDVLMPGMDGFETAVKIKQHGRTPDVPIILLTAAGAEPELAFRGYAAGAVDYIPKPFDPWVLRAKVSVYVDLYLKNQQLRAVSGLVSAIEAAAAGLAALPAALASEELTDRLGRLDGTIATLRSALGPGKP
ncbi:MAG TPA: response regulator [Trebonia sp.]|nr:response regulator [Trebonia sp.]